jgi:hypothetical protein
MRKERKGKQKRKKERKKERKVFFPHRRKKLWMWGGECVGEWGAAGYLRDKWKKGSEKKKEKSAMY